MRVHRLLGVVALAAVMGVPAAAQVSWPEVASTVAYERRSGDRIDVGVFVRGARGRAFRWDMSVDSPAGPWVALGLHALDHQGAGRAEREVGSTLAGRDLFFRVVYHDGTATVSTPPVHGSFLEEPTGDLMEASWGFGGIALPSGEPVSSAQPWSEFVTIVGRNNDPTHPDAVVLLDESRWDPPGTTGLPGMKLRRPEPTGTASEGSGAGKLLVVASDTADADQDGLVDRPRSEPAGGQVIFLFAGPTRAPFLSVFDVDEPGGRVRAFAGPTLLGEDDIPVGADRSIQELVVPGGFSLITKLIVELAGTGGVGTLSMIPCPAVLSFDETTTGVPLGLVAGEELGGAYGNIGLFHGFVTAVNNDSGGPELALLYDSSDPGAAHPDLATPGTGSGNDTPYRKVLVVSGNDVDADADGVVDVPTASSAGGSLTLGWITSDVFFQSATVIDVDEDETGFVRVWDRVGGFTDLPLASLGDNSVQTVAAVLGPTRQIELFVSGRAALAEVRVCSD